MKISHARTVVFHSFFELIFPKRENILSNVNVAVSRQDKRKTAHFRLPYVAQKSRVLNLLLDSYQNLCNNQINARALIGQSALVYCASKLMEMSRVFLKCYYDQKVHFSFFLQILKACLLDT